MTALAIKRNLEERTMKCRETNDVMDAPVQISSEAFVDIYDFFRVIITLWRCTISGGRRYFPRFIFVLFFFFVFSA